MATGRSDRNNRDLFFAISTCFQVLVVDLYVSLLLAFIAVLGLVGRSVGKLALYTMAPAAPPGCIWILASLFSVLAFWRPPSSDTAFF